MGDPIKFTARLGDVLGWDQKPCYVLVVDVGSAGVEFCRAHRDAEVEVALTLPGPEPPKPAAKVEQGDLFVPKGRRWGG
jgi:hypothetical protein